MSKKVVPFLLLFLLLQLVPKIARATDEIRPISLQSGTMIADAGWRTERKTFSLRYGIVQLTHIPTDADRQLLSESGITLLRYIPEMSWLAIFSETATPQTLPIVHWAGKLRPEDKLSSAFSLMQVDRPIVDVALWPFVASDLLKKWGNFQPTEIENTYRGEVSAEQLHQLAEQEEVQSITPHFSAESLGTPPTNQLALTGSDLVQAAPYSLLGTNTRVGIFDLGAVAPHEELEDRVTVSSYAGTVSSHATFVAGLAGGKQYGYAPTTKLNSYYFTETAPISTKAVDIAVQVWGYSECVIQGQYNLASAQVDQLSELPQVFAAGNTGAQCEGKKYGTLLGGPQSAKNVITVGAVDDNGNIAAFSSRGPALDGRIAPTLVAPGVQLYSSCSNNQYCHASGTSYAAPLVGGALAQLLQYYHEQHSLDQSPLPSTFRAVLAHTATDRGNKGPDYEYGFGLLDLPNALRGLDLVSEHSITNGETVQLNHIVTSGEHALRVTLAWDDLPATAVTGKTLINDLDLVLIDPSGQSYLPLILDPSQPENLATPREDHLNVIEQSIIESPTQGEWRIMVKGNNVTTAEQKFSIVIGDAESIISADELGTSPTSIALVSRSAETTSSYFLFFSTLMLAVGTLAKWLTK